MTNPPKPILKWVGGKTQLLDNIMKDIPREINNYREIFVGGGSVLFSVLHSIQMGTIKIRGNIYVYDKNEPLIYVYKNIQSKPNELYEEMIQLIREYNSCGYNTVNRNPITKEEAIQNKENYYYWIRKRYNQLDKKTTIGSAMFIFLNKTCFRGLFRIGPNGFNVPYGHYKNPEILNKEHLDVIHNLLYTYNVILECCDYTTSLLYYGIETDDFIYLDPPYAPEKETSFVGYTEGGFTKENHTILFQMIHTINMEKRGVKMLLHNSDVGFVRENFTDDIYTISSLLCKRAINSKNPDMKTGEVIIRNYKL